MMWFIPEDGSQLCDFELEAGGPDLGEWGGDARVDELRRTILYLVHDRNSILVKLRGLRALKNVLLHAKMAQDQANIYPAGWDAGRFERSSLTSGFGLDKEIATPHGAEKLQNDEQPASLYDDNQEVNTDSLKENEIITKLRQANRELHGHVQLLQEVTWSSDSNENCWEGCSKRLRNQLVRYITRTRKLEKALHTKEVLCSFLADKLNVMKEEKAKTSGIQRMSNKGANENSILSNSGATMDSTFSNGGGAAGQQGNGMNRNLSEEKFENSPNEGSEDQVRKRFMNGGVGCRDEEELVSKEKLELVKKELSQTKDELGKMSADKAKLENCIKELQDSHAKDEQGFRAQNEKLLQEKRQLQDAVLQFQSNELKQKQEFEQMLFRVKEMLDRERQEKFSSIAEQKSLRQQVENLSKTMKTLQVKNEEFVRFHCDQEDQIDDFKRLKKLIQDNGLPSIEQLIVLQRQNETYREDFLNERKEKERILSLKDKLKRDLDGAQSRISSLQEQVYKYREHIYFLQQKFRQEGISQSGSPMFDMPVQTQGNNLSKLYGSSAPQYINEGLLPGNASGKFPGAPLPDGKKPGPGKYGDGPGKPWQYQQGNFGRYGRQMSEDWKRGSSQEQATQQQQPWDAFYTPSQSPGRLSSAGSVSSGRSGSSSSEDVASEGQINGRAPYGMGGRRQGPRPAVLPDKPLDESRALHQNYGPPLSPFEAWSPKHPGFLVRGQRRYSSPTGNGIRSPTTDYWHAQPQMGGFQRSWQTSAEQAQFADSTPVSLSSGLRPTADPWPGAVTSGQNSSYGQSPVASSVPVDTMVSMSGGFTGMR